LSNFNPGIPIWCEVLAGRGVAFDLISLELPLNPFGVQGISFTDLPLFGVDDDV